MCRYFSTSPSSDDLAEPSGSGFNLVKAEEHSKAEQDEGTADEDAAFIKFAKGMTLCVCYSANVGGTATLTGTTPNVIMAEYVEE